MTRPPRPAPVLVMTGNTLKADFDETLNAALDGASDAQAASCRMYSAALARAEAAEAERKERP